METLSPEMTAAKRRGETLWGLARAVLADARNDFVTLPLWFTIVLIGCSTMAIVSSALFRRGAWKRVAV
jgi:hypothetical protein